MTSTRRDGDAAAHTLIGAYALDALDDVERAAVDRHLRRCPDCAVEAGELRAATARLADTAAEQPPPGLRARVLAAAAQTPQRGPRRATAPAPPARWPRLVAVAAALAVLVAGGGAVGYAVQQHRVDQIRRQAAADRHRDAQLDALLAAPDATVVSRTLDDGSRIRVIKSAQRDQAAVYLNDLAPAPAGHVYQLWLVTGATALSEGVVPAGSRSYTGLLTGWRGKERFAISTEPGPHGSAQPTHLYTSVTLT